MPKVFNLYDDPAWDRTEERPGWVSRDAWVGHHVGAELIGGSLYELEPGSRLWPYHSHHVNEEWVVVVRGEPTLRTPDGETVLHEGDVVAFPRGDAGLHQVRNRTDRAVRVLMLSSMVDSDILEYPDSGKVAAVANGKRVFRTFRGPDAEYWEGED